MDENAIDFFERHSVNFLEMALQTEKLERVENADAYGKYSRECGDTLEIFLTLQNGNIESAAFYTEGCIFTVACANTLVHLIEDRPVRDAWRISPQRLIDFLQTLPETEYHCAELAVETLREALRDSQSKRS